MDVDTKMTWKEDDSQPVHNTLPANKWGKSGHEMVPVYMWLDREGMTLSVPLFEP